MGKRIRRYTCFLTSVRQIGMMRKTTKLYLFLVDIFVNSYTCYTTGGITLKIRKRVRIHSGVYNHFMALLDKPCRVNL
jgi:hypothetical protein